MALCEAFFNQVLIARDFQLDLPASGAWERVPVAPVRAIAEIDGVTGDGNAAPLASDAYTFDIEFIGRRLGARVAGGRRHAGAGKRDGGNRR